MSVCKLKICRICLRSHCKMYNYDQFQLKLHYQELMALHMDKKQNLPRYFCYECAALLCKFRKFKEKCYTAQNKLLELQWRSAISYDAVENLRSDIKCINSPIDVMIVSERVKTYYYDEDFNSAIYISDSESIKDTSSLDVQISEVKSIEVKYVNEHEESFQIDAEHDTTNDFESDIAAETVNHQQETTKSVVNEDEKELPIENTEQDSTNILKSLLTHCNPKDIKFQSSNKKLIKKDKNVERCLDLKSNKNHNTMRKKNRKRVKKKDVDFEPDNFSVYGLKERNPAFAKKKKRILDPSHWKKSTLTEDEVLMDMKKKAEDPKYLAAEYKCTDCVKWFRVEDILKRHRQLRHDEKIGTMECRFCHMRFKWDCHLRRHLWSHFNKYECLRCDLVCPLISTALLHEDYHNGVIKKCKHCGEEFKHSSTYYTHLRTHRSEYLCTLCGMSFVSNVGLLMHKKVKHVASDVGKEEVSEETDTYCTKCHMQFETVKAYEVHLFHSALHTEDIEDDIQPFKNIFDDDEDKPLSKLTQRNILVRKRKLPLKVKHRKPTTCHQCGKHFNTQKECMAHHLAEHRGTSFFPPSERQICEICGMSLAPGSVAMHLNTHTREKLHSCETCGKQFSTIVSLKRHQVTHTGEKKFPCPLCEKRFTQNNSMKLHYRTYHLKEPYPKRNRRKKEMRPEPLDHEESTSGDSFHDNNRRPAYTKRTMQYLTLS